MVKYLSTVKEKKISIFAACEGQNGGNKGESDGEGGGDKGGVFRATGGDQTAASCTSGVISAWTDMAAVIRSLCY